MKILFLGDIVGRSGRDIISSSLSNIVNENDIDLVIANGENAAHGKGLTYRLYNELLLSGINYFTMGNHSFSKNEIFDNIDKMDKMLLPINLNSNKYGHRYIITEVKGLKICIFNVMGEVLMNDTTSDPYVATNELLQEINDLDIDIIFVDIHAETTAEKRLFAEYYKDRIDICVGTHTHVQTADEQMIGDLAYITDVGMCGPYYSVIGRDINEVISNRINKEKTHYTISTSDAILCGVIIDVDEEKKKAIDIKRIQLRPEEKTID